MVSNYYLLKSDFACILDNFIDGMHPIRVIEAVHMIIFVDGVEEVHFGSSYKIIKTILLMVY
jgi:hypothetical protein